MRTADFEESNGEIVPNSEDDTEDEWHELVTSPYEKPEFVSEAFLSEVLNPMRMTNTVSNASCARSPSP